MKFSRVASRLELLPCIPAEFYPAGMRRNWGVTGGTRRIRSISEGNRLDHEEKKNEAFCRVVGIGLHFTTANRCLCFADIVRDEALCFDSIIMSYHSMD